MNARPPFHSAQVEPLVRAYLEAESQSVDVARMRAEIARREAIAASNPTDTIVGDGPVERALRPRASWAWRLGLAACLLVAVGLGGLFALWPESANAYALVRAAESNLAKTRDRCYRIESQVPKAWLRNNPFLNSGEETLLWTRGDRFRVSTTLHGQQLAWGQDDSRRLWIASDPMLGIQFDRDEVPPAFARTRAYLAVDVRRLAGRFLESFDLKLDRAGAGDSGVVVIHATASAGQKPFPFNAARLEIERKTKVIRKMELLRVMEGTVKVRFTFTLIDEQPPAAESYRLASQLRPGARVLDRADAPRRDQALRDLMDRLD